MTERESGERMAVDDVFFSMVLIVGGIFATHKNWLESDWWGMLGTVLLTLFGCLWLAIRIYHLTHRDEVFGKEQHNDN